MKRITTLAAVVLALAAVPVALADNGGPTQPAAAAPQGQQQAGHAGVRARLEILRLRLRIVDLRFALHCRGGVSNAPQQCADFANKVEQRLQQLDANVQKRIQDLQACASGSTDPRCNNADRKIAFLQKVDTRVQALIAKVQGWLNGTSTNSGSSGGTQSSNRVQRLQQLDAGVQQRIQTLQSCTTSTDSQCRNADQKIARLQAIDQKLQAAIAKLQGSSSGGSDTSSSANALDQAANGLNQLAQSVGSTVGANG